MCPPRSGAGTFARGPNPVVDDEWPMRPREVVSQRPATDFSGLAPKTY